MSSQSVDTKSLLVHEKTILHNSVTICGSGCGRGLVVNTPAHFNNKVILQDDIDLSGTLKVNNIEEETSGSGILVDGFRIKDGTAYVNDNPLCEVENKCNKDQPNGYAGLDGGGKVPITSLASQPLIFRGCWDANTNTPSLMSGVGNNGDYYIVCMAGSTNLDGYNTWSVGDAAVFTAGAPGNWTRLDNVDAVLSVNGQTGVVSLSLDNLNNVTVPAPSTGQGLYFDGANWVNTPVVRTIEGVSPALPSGNIDLIAGTDINITSGINSITIASTAGSSVALTSAGGTETLVNDGTGPSLATKGLTAGSNVTLTSNANSITISATGTPSGSVITFAGATAPSGWVLCDGTLYNGTNPIYAALWSVIGITYGGTGISSFSVPDMRGRFVFGLGAGSATPLAGTGGTETNTLGYTNLPGFILVRRDQGGAGLLSEPASGNYWNNGIGSSVITTGPAAAITNLPPYLVMNYIIKL